MPELSPIDLESYTKGRLARNDYETKRVLSAAQGMVRNYCRWHVSPVRVNETLTLSGPGDWGGWGVGAGYTNGGTYYGGGSALHRVRVGGQVLMLPTKRLQGIASLVEDGVPLDISALQFDQVGNVIKNTHQRWSVNMGGIVVTFTHGWTEDEAADWRQIVLMVADRMSLVRGLVGPFELTVGPYRTGAASDPFDDLLNQINADNYVRMSV
jgi:hypothetical protein